MNKNVSVKFQTRAGLAVMYAEKLKIKYGTIEIDGVTLNYGDLVVGEIVWVVDAEGNNMAPDDGTYEIEGVKVTLVGGVITEVEEVTEQTEADPPATPPAPIPVPSNHSEVDVVKVIAPLVTKLSEYAEKFDALEKRINTSGKAAGNAAGAAEDKPKAGEIRYVSLKNPVN